MKHLLLATILLTTLACGRKTIHTTVENNYDDSSIRSELVLQDARIRLLEDKLNDLITQDQLDARLEVLSSIETRLSNLESSSVELVTICSSKELLLKVGDIYYGVISTITSAGLASKVHLGVIPEFKLYQTTDGTNQLFQIEYGNIACK